MSQHGGYALRGLSWAGEGQSKLSCPGCRLHSIRLLELASARAAGLPAGTKGAVASILFFLPVVKHFFTWMGCLPCDKRHMMDALTNGTSLGVMPEARCVPSCLGLRASGPQHQSGCGKVPDWWRPDGLWQWSAVATARPQQSAPASVSVFPDSKQSAASDATSASRDSGRPSRVLRASSRPRGTASASTAATRAMRAWLCRLGLVRRWLRGLKACRHQLFTGRHHSATLTCKGSLDTHTALNSASSCAPA